MLRGLLVGFVAFVTMVLSPFGCGGGGRGGGYRYGAEEMRAAVEGTWMLDLPANAQAPARQLRIALRQAGAPAQPRARGGLVRTAWACDSRTLVRSAHACMDATTMPLEVIHLAGLDADAATRGDFTAIGLSFHSGNLSLALGDATMNAVVAADGTVLDVRSTWGDEDDGVVLQRVALPSAE